MESRILLFMKALTKFCRQHWFGLLEIVILFLGILFRLYQFNLVPAALYWEEAALLYDAYSLSETGHDMHGNFLPILAVESFGDNKPSGYFYALVPLIKIFGVQDWVVKMPSLLAGIFIIFMSGKLWQSFFSKKGKTKTNCWSLVIMLLVACNPSLIHLSHVGFETNLGLAFLMLGIWCLWTIKENRRVMTWQFWGGEVCLWLSFYTYHAYRIVAPLVGLYLGIRFVWQKRKEWQSCWRLWLGAAILTGVCVLPLIGGGNNEALTSRFQDTTIFGNLDLIIKSNECRATHEDFLAKFYCHRYVYFAGFIGESVGRVLNPQALFWQGDGQLRHSPGPWGFFYPFELVFLGGAIFFLVKNWKKNRPVFIFWGFWLLVSLIPSLLTYDNPHLLRNLAGLPVWLMIFTLGIRQLDEGLLPCLNDKKLIRDWQRLFFMLLSTWYLMFVAIFLRYYGTTYREQSSRDWQNGYKQAMKALKTLQEKYPNLPFYITDDFGRPSIYYFLYAGIEPEQVQRAKNEKMLQSEFMTWNEQESAFGGPMNANREQVVVLSEADWQILTSESSQAAELLKEQIDVNDLDGKLNFRVGHWLGKK